MRRRFLPPAVAPLHRVRNRSSRVAVASLRRLGAAATMIFSAVSCFLRVGFVFSSCFLRVFYLPKFEAGRWLFLIGSAIPEGRAAPSRTTTMFTITTHHAARSKKFQISPSSDFC
jgi:hypothetical protein